MNSVVLTNKDYEISSGDYDSSYCYIYKARHESYICATKKELALKIKAISTKIESTGNLFFLKQCSYPRYKLKDSKRYKKVNSLDNADFVVYSPKMPVWECNPRYRKVFFQYTDDKQSFKIIVGAHILATYPAFELGWEQALLQLMMKHCATMDSDLFIENPKLENITLLHSGTYCTVRNKDLEMFDLLITDKLFNLVTAADLGKEVDKDFSCPTIQILLNVCEFLDSKDPGNQEVGWKTLVGMNMAEIPNVTEFLIRTHGSHIPYNVRQSVGFKSILSTVGLEMKSISFYDRSIDSVVSCLDFTDVEIPIINALCERYMQGVIASILSTYEPFVKKLHRKVYMEFTPVDPEECTDMKRSC